MSRIFSEQDLAAVEAILLSRQGPLTARAIFDELDMRIPLRTFQYRLKYLVDQGRIEQHGTGRWARYTAPRFFAAVNVEMAAEERSDTARSILQAAKEGFLRRGYDVSLDRIASRAGVTKPTIYAHFKDKEELFRSAMADAAEEMIPALPVPSLDGDLRAELLAYARAFRAMVTSERRLLAYRTAILDMEDASSMGLLLLRRSLMRINQGLADFFAALMARGVIRNAAPDLLSEYFFAAAGGQARTRRLMGFEADTVEREEEYLGLFIDSFLDGIRVAI